MQLPNVPCPHCGVPAVEATPVIDQAAALVVGVWTDYPPDKLVGFDLVPCGHRVVRIEWDVMSGWSLT